MSTRLAIALVLSCTAFASAGPATDDWKIGKPIVTYWAGPELNPEVVAQMADGGFNVVWCAEKDLDLVHEHGLRGMLRDELLAPESLNDPQRTGELDALIDRVSRKPGMYCYFITDEPATPAFPALAKLVSHLRQRDPAHMAYINLMPTYATNDQLGTKGDTVPAYRQYVQSFVKEVQPALLSYDHYQFYKTGDTDQYFLNLSLIRQMSLDAGVPFLNIVQAASWQPKVRVPNADETRYLVYTTLAYGAQGISYYVYYAKGHEGGIATAEGKPTPIYAALKTLNPEFVAIATELQPLRSIAVYHTTMKEPGCVALPADAPFRPTAEPKTVTPPATPAPHSGRGLLLGYFGPHELSGAPTHVMVVNLDYKAETRTTITGPADLERFDPATSKWTPVNANQVLLTLPPGGGALLRIRSK